MSAVLFTDHNTLILSTKLLYFFKLAIARTEILQNYLDSETMSET